MNITEFKIDIDDEEINDLKRRLDNTRFPESLILKNSSSWQDGSSLEFMRRIVTYWSTKFDWKAQESRLNRLNQFKTKIDNTNIHFVHVKGLTQKRFPLIMTHGWPGSFIEFIEMIPMLTNPQQFGIKTEFSFDLVIPSLPGFGFSEAPTDITIDSSKIADIWSQLMCNLGYTSFGVHGGDIGAGVSIAMASQSPDIVRGIHVNYMPGDFRPAKNNRLPFTLEEIDYLNKLASWSEIEGAYEKIHATKPQSLAYGLLDSPIGLAAWIVEKFQSWTDSNGKIEDAVSIDTLLTNLSIYWFSKNILSTLNLYKNNKNNAIFRFNEGVRIIPPFGMALFPEEISTPPRSYVERCFNVVHWNHMSKGGHFAALEQPKMLADDLFDFFAKV